MEFIVSPQTKFLDSELFKKETGCNLFVRDNDLIVSGCKTQKEADDLIDKHNPAAPQEITIEQKLALVGLSIDDLKQALGL